MFRLCRSGFQLGSGASEVRGLGLRVLCVVVVDRRLDRVLSCASVSICRWLEYLRVSFTKHAAVELDGW
jgi:hypothetical protein